MSSCFFSSPRVFPRIFVPPPTVVCAGRVVPGQRSFHHHGPLHCQIPRPPVVQIDLDRGCGYRCWPRVVSYPHHPARPPVLMPVNPFMRPIVARPLFGRVGVRFP